MKYLFKKRESNTDRSNLNEGLCIDSLTHQTELDHGIEPLFCIGITQRAPLHLVRMKIGSYCNQKNKCQKFAVSFHLIIYNKTELKLSGEQALS